MIELRVGGFGGVGRCHCIRVDSGGVVVMTKG
jgi:hypothetical protein